MHLKTYNIIFQLIFILNLNNLYIHYGSKYNINPKWLKCLSISESNENIYAINHKKKCIYFNNYNSAKLYINNVSINDQIDIGLFQINKYWFNKLELNLVTGLNPNYNTEIACILLTEIFQRKGYSFKSLPYFHNPKFKLQYYKHLLKIYNKL